MMLITNKIMKMNAILLLIWYAGARWVILTNFSSGDFSTAWAANEMGNYVAIITILYLLCYIFMTDAHNQISGFISMTVFLFIINGYFLLRMSNGYAANPTSLNLIYLLLDIYISVFFGAAWALVKKTNTNKEVTERCNVNLTI